MLDPRVSKLAHLMATHSLGLKTGDRLLIHAFDMPDTAVAEFVRVCKAQGAQVAVRMESNRVRRMLLHEISEDNVKMIARNEKFEMEAMSHYLALRGGANAFELADVPSASMATWQRDYAKPVVFETRVPKTRWVVMRWPDSSMAQQASMSTDAFEDYFFDVCTVDYVRMQAACVPLKDLMDKTDRVRITGPGTEISFSIKDIGSVACAGEANIPDGECFTAPIRESMNGMVQYNTASVHMGLEYKDIRFEVKDGKIVDAQAGAMTERLNRVLDTDEGARYFGEWSLGFNPNVLHPIKDTLFDEKIAGSFHLTPGNAYEPPGGNGNESAIHWDIVCIQRPEYGGGEIYFDDVLIRKDGLFVLDSLAGLNPDRLG